MHSMHFLWLYYILFYYFIILLFKFYSGRIWSLHFGRLVFYNIQGKNKSFQRYLHFLRFFIYLRI